MYLSVWYSVSLLLLLSPFHPPPLFCPHHHFQIHCFPLSLNPPPSPPPYSHPPPPPPSDPFPVTLRFQSLCNPSPPSLSLSSRSVHLSCFSWYPPQRTTGRVCHESGRPELRPPLSPVGSNQCVFKAGTSVATLPGVWLCKVSVRTGRSCAVSLDWTARFTRNFCLGVAACTIV